MYGIYWKGDDKIKGNVPILKNACFAGNGSRELILAVKTGAIENLAGEIKTYL